MEWDVILDKDFAYWLESLEIELQNEILAHAKLLSAYGPQLGRPKVDTVEASQFPNMKELRIQFKGNPWRILFAFDPKRRAALLVGGCKQGDKRWYKTHIPIADERFRKHLIKMEKPHA